VLQILADLSPLRLETMEGSMKSSTLSVRISDDLRNRLDRATVRTSRTRNQIVKMALEKHLDRIVSEELAQPQSSSIERLMSFKGKGATPSSFRSGEEVDAYIRRLRGDD
jgi:predicted DNA-binding protein